MEKLTAKNLTVQDLIKDIKVGDTITYFYDKYNRVGDDINISKLETHNETVIAIDEGIYCREFHLKSGIGQSENIKIFLSNNKVIIISKIFRVPRWSHTESISFGLDIRSTKSSDYDGPAIWNNDIVCINLPNFGWVQFNDSL